MYRAGYDTETGRPKALHGQFRSVMVGYGQLCQLWSVMVSYGQFCCISHKEGPLTIILHTGTLCTHWLGLGVKLCSAQHIHVHVSLRCIAIRTQPAELPR